MVSRLTRVTLGFCCMIYFSLFRLSCQTYQRPAIKEAKEPEKSEKIQDEANTKLKEALAKQQLTAKNYNRVFNLINSDEALCKKAMKLIEDERKEG